MELMSVFGIMLDQNDEQREYPAEVVTLAKELAGYTGANPGQAVDVLLDCRADARANKDFALADKVRDGLTGLGFAIEDTPQGARVTYSA